ncbi:MAG TPA: hypothetical protein VGH28_00110 [Polyangiaceae bacterium]|jgi:hypothetical protein
MKRVLLLALALTGCGARSEIGQGLTSTSCTAAAPICVQSAPNACDAPAVVKASCDESAKQWVCPSGASVYERAADSTGICRPFHATPGLASVGAWGLGGVARVPTDDGRCLWIADGVAFEPDLAAPFGTCPETSVMPPTPIVTIEGGDEGGALHAQIDDGYRLGGVTHVLYRLFRDDPSAAFGVVELGGGVGRWDPVTQRVIVHGPAAFPWGLDLDLGDASLVADGSHAFVWGCAQPGPTLLDGCELARLDENDSVELFGANGSWLPTTDASQGATVFFSGPWTSSVVGADGGLRHLYISGFGDRIQTQVSSIATGPWTDGADVAACDLPADPKSFCAGPIAHPELADPTRPNELPVSYSVGTTSGTPLSADDGWTRLIWAE